MYDQVKGSSTQKREAPKTPFLTEKLPTADGFREKKVTYTPMTHPTPMHIVTSQLRHAQFKTVKRGQEIGRELGSGYPEGLGGTELRVDMIKTH